MSEDLELAVESMESPVAVSVQPIGNRVLFKPELQADHITKGGILVPGSVKKEKEGQGGIVVAVGPDIEAKLAIGDRIIVTAYSGVRIKIEGQTHFLVNDTDILAVVGTVAVELED